MNAPVTYHETFLSRELADYWFEKLWNELAWVRRDNVPRREYWTNTFDRPYTYGNGPGVRTYEAQPDNFAVARARAILQAQTKTFYEGCFLNGYEDGIDALGWHADNDPKIDHTRPIAIITLYGEPSRPPRTIQFKEVIEPGSETKKPVFGPVETLALGHGSLAVMAPGMQHTHRHQIPKAGFVCSPRISMTFRGLVRD